MTHSCDQQPPPKLSICITTRNRASCIGATLESILPQLTIDCELVLLDAASTDETARVVAQFARRYDCLRYIRQDTNNGLDRDYDHAVELAHGEFCWLMTDDDLLKPGAVAVVLETMRKDLSLIVINVEIRDVSLSRILSERWLPLEADRLYAPNEMDRLFADVANFLKYIGGVVIKREVWLSRDRGRYYGTWFIHVGVIFQARLPGAAQVISQPLIILRWGNEHTFSQKVMDILFGSWPALAPLLDVSARVKASVHSLEPWRHLYYLLHMRSLGNYSMEHYRRFFKSRLHSLRERLVPIVAAMMPGLVVNALFVLYYRVSDDRFRDLRLHDLRRSRFHLRNFGEGGRVW